ncbi:MAG: maleylpyruvate isomerase family mycothiol-dependent enzyme, partial [Streptosporangiales bacterium]|nr:maleylpyruvate isomerase family mycothiol-dependent enzyme [Streptosporangiales bacterium]
MILDGLDREVVAVTTTLEMAQAERAELAGFLKTLSEEDWAAGSLCTAWSVRQVVAHVISYDRLGVGGSLARLARSGFRLGRSNATGVAELARRSPEELVALLEENAEVRGP